MKFDLIHKELTSSTMDDCRTAIESGAVTAHSLTAILARQQSKGRGLPDKQTGQSRQWLSPLGNLYLSYTVPIATEASTWEATFPAALHMRTVLSRYLQDGMPITLKWPNDFFLGDKKFGGILVERHEGYFIVGIGIDVFTSVDTSQAVRNAGYSATKLIDHLNPESATIAQITSPGQQANFINTLTTQFLTQQAAFLNANPRPTTLAVMRDIGFITDPQEPIIRFQLRGQGDQPTPSPEVIKAKFIQFLPDVPGRPDLIQVEIKGQLSELPTRDVVLRVSNRSK